MILRVTWPMFRLESKHCWWRDWLNSFFVRKSNQTFNSREKVMNTYTLHDQDVSHAAQAGKRSNKEFDWAPKQGMCTTISTKK